MTVEEIECALFDHYLETGERIRTHIVSMDGSKTLKWADNAYDEIADGDKILKAKAHAERINQGFGFNNYTEIVVLDQEI